MVTTVVPTVLPSSGNSEVTDVVSRAEEVCSRIVTYSISVVPIVPVVFASSVDHEVD